MISLSCSWLASEARSAPLSLFIYFIFISLTTKGKVSTEGNEAYRGVTYKKEHIQTLVQKTKQLQKQKYKTTTYRDNKKLTYLTEHRKLYNRCLKLERRGTESILKGIQFQKQILLTKKEYLNELMEDCLHYICYLLNRML